MFLIIIEYCNILFLLTLLFLYWIDILIDEVLPSALRYSREIIIRTFIEYIYKIKSLFTYLFIYLS